MNPRRILIVDDHPMVREWLAQIINRERDLRVCAEAGDAATAISFLATHQPDMAIVDLTLKDSHGTELIRAITAEFPAVPVLVVSMHDESLYGERAIRAGAKGYITKQEAGAQIRAAIRQVLGGELYLSEALAAKMIRANAAGAPRTRTQDLSDRQLAVLRLIGRGHSTTQIGEEMALSIKTVEGYIARIKKKLGLTTAGELLQYAIEFNSERRS